MALPTQISGFLRLMGENAPYFDGTKYWVVSQDDPTFGAVEIYSTTDPINGTWSGDVYLAYVEYEPGWNADFKIANGIFIANSEYGSAGSGDRAAYMQYGTLTVGYPENAFFDYSIPISYGYNPQAMHVLDITPGNQKAQVFCLQGANGGGGAVDVYFGAASYNGGYQTQTLFIEGFTENILASGSVMLFEDTVNNQMVCAAYCADQLSTPYPAAGHDRLTYRTWSINSKSWNTLTHLTGLGFTTSAPHALTDTVVMTSDPETSGYRAFALAFRPGLNPILIVVTESGGSLTFTEVEQTAYSAQECEIANGKAEASLTLTPDGRLAVVYLGTDGTLYYRKRLATYGTDQFGPAIALTSISMTRPRSRIITRSGKETVMTAYQASGVSRYNEFPVPDIVATGIPSAEAFGTAKLNQRLTVPTVPSSLLYVEDFETGTPTDSWEWNTSTATPDSITYLNQSPIKTRVVELEGYSWGFRPDRRFPYHSNVLYSTGVRIRQSVVGSVTHSRLRIGVNGRNDAGTFINAFGDNSLSNQAYMAVWDSRIDTLGDRWSTFNGFFQGNSTAAPVTPPQGPDTPNTLYTGVTQIEPVCITSYSGDGNKFQIDELWIGQHGSSVSRSAELIQTTQVGATSITSQEAFGSPQLLQEQRALPTGILSQEAIGSSQLIQEQFVSGASADTQEAFGNAALTLLYTLSGILGIESAEAVPSVSINMGEALVGATPANEGETFGTATLLVEVLAEAIPTGEAFGAPQVQATYDIGATAIGSDEDVVSPALNLTISVASIASSEQIGTAKLNLRVEVNSVQEGEEIGDIRINYYQQLPTMMGTIL